MLTPLIISTFCTVFLAEMGDKTQLATMAISGSSKRPLAVFLGSSSALVLASLLGAIAGGSLQSLIPDTILEIASSLGFIFIGTKILIPSIKSKNGST